MGALWSCTPRAKVRRGRGCEGERCARFGGAHALLPPSPGTPHQPATTPAASILPLWNSVALFAVAPGRSFHAIQEVAERARSPRMSIQGWFHSSAPPPDAHLATRRQLQSTEGVGDDAVAADRPFRGLRVGELTAQLDAGDASYLAPYLAPAYLDPANLTKVLAAFREDGSVQLTRFLSAPWAAALAAATAAADAADGLGGGRLPAYDAGIGNGWAAAGPAHKQRFLAFAGDGGGRAPDRPTATGRGEAFTDPAAAAPPGTPPAAAAGRLLAHLGEHLLGSAPFARWLAAATSLAPASHSSLPRRFRPGLDYTVAHCGAVTVDAQLDAVLTFTAEAGGGEGGGPRAPPDAASVWGAGEVGGYEAYLLADESGEAAEYQAGAGGDDDGGVLNVSPFANALSLVARDAGLLRFVKYVSSAAPGARWDVAAVFELADDGGASEDDA